MTGKIQTRLAMLAALAALVAVLVPATLAFGSHDGEDPIVSGDPSIVYLSMGNQDRITWQTQSVNIQTRNNNCTFVQYSPTILSIGAEGTGALGQVKDGFGVQSMGDGSGEPCGRVEADDDEMISVTLGSGLSGYLMNAIDVDLELKFNAVVDVLFYHDGNPIPAATIANWSGTDASDDGPDSKDLDNFRFSSLTYHTGDTFYYDKVVFMPKAGAISLEGGADLNLDDGIGTLAPVGASTAEKLASQFRVVKAFDGEISCGESAEIGVNGSLETVYGKVTMHALDLDLATEESGEWILEDCIRKPFDSGSDQDSIEFVPEFANSQARYTIEVEVPGQEITVVNGVITSLIAEYDPDGGITFPTAGTTPLQACNGTPPLIVGSPEYIAFWTQDDPMQIFDPYIGEDVNILPDGQNICFYRATAEVEGDDVGTESWGILFIDDPGLNFR